MSCPFVVSARRGGELSFIKRCKSTYLIFGLEKNSHGRRAKKLKSLFLVLDVALAIRYSRFLYRFELIRETDANTIQIYRVTLAARSHQIYLLFNLKSPHKIPQTLRN